MYHATHASDAMREAGYPFAVDDGDGVQVDGFHTRRGALYAAHELRAGRSMVQPHNALGCRVQPRQSAEYRYLCNTLRVPPRGLDLAAIVDAMDAEEMAA